LKGNPLQSATLDKTARFGDIYEYTAQRVERLTVATKSGAQTLELPGEVSPPVRVDVLDTFPPAIPTGLVAVAVAEEKAIDLSWQPDTDEDLAGYIVYRISVSGEASSSWQRVSGDQPIPTPAWRDPSVEPGHSYRYAVTAIDLTGHESKRSIETEESVPAS
jgi:fibronectin type 3 domain-containing protein